MGVVAAMDTVYTIDEIAQMLRVHRNTVQSWIARGELAAIKTGTKQGYRITQQDLDDFIKRKRTDRGKDG